MFHFPDQRINESRAGRDPLRLIRGYATHYPPSAPSWGTSLSSLVPALTNRAMNHTRRFQHGGEERQHG